MQATEGKLLDLLHIVNDGCAKQKNCHDRTLSPKSITYRFNSSIPLLLGSVRARLTNRIIPLLIMVTNQN